MTNISRRSFLQRSAVAAAAFTVAPSSILGKSHGHIAPSDKLNVAAVGISGVGRSNLRAVSSTENIVALCDIDWKIANSTFETYPSAKRFWDWRTMFDEMGKEIEAVIVATADHTHAIIAGHAMTLGKHVYVQKPLTHSVYESRLLTKLAAHYKVATQMGNQGASNPGVRQMCDWIADGQIGEVTKVECATNRPIWPQGLNTPKQGMWVPDSLKWDLFTGPAKMVPYHDIYHPWNWRGWWNYGTGALGDMACHVMHPIFKGLKLEYPIKAQGSSTMLLVDCAPVAQKVKLTFPARPQFNTKKVKYPEVEVIWTDGGILPEYPKNWPTDLVPSTRENQPPRPRQWEIDGPVIFHGTKDSMVCGCYGVRPWLLSGRTPESPKTQREVPNNRHEQDWVRACKESPENRVETASNFAEAGPFNEMVVMGVLAVRLQGLGKELSWDGPNMRFTNIDDNETITWIEEDKFSVVDGNPNINPVRSDPLNAKATAEELIKHTYREGWSLPPMP